MSDWSDQVEQSILPFIDDAAADDDAPSSSSSSSSSTGLDGAMDVDGDGDVDDADGGDDEPAASAGRLILADAETLSARLGAFPAAPPLHTDLETALAHAVEVGALCKRCVGCFLRP